MYILEKIIFCKKKMFNTDNNNNNLLLFRNIKLMAKVLTKID